MTPPNQSERRDALTRLAERVEAAEGPDRSIDLAIVFHLYGPDKDMKGCVERGSFSPTASLDAAMTLVPEGWAVERAGWHNLGEPHAGVELWQYDPTDAGGWVHHSRHVIVKGNSTLPALALCAAALRALAAKEA